MSKDDKPTRREAAKFRKLQSEVSAGKDVVAAAQAIGAKAIIKFEDALNNHEVAKLFAAPKNKGGRPTKYDPSWMLEEVREAGRYGASKDKMAQSIGVHIDTVYEWIDKYPEFSEAIKEATQLSKVWWENFGQLSALGMIEGFNATNWIFNMKNRFPETYRDVKVTEVNNKGAPLIDARSITINARELDDDVRDRLREALMAAKLLEAREDDDE